MRVLAITFLALLPGAAGAASVGPAPAVAVEKSAPPLPGQGHCRRATSYHAFDSSKPVKPQKLTELPPGTAFMAVHRTIGGCEVPLTVIEYRNGRGRSSGPGE